MTLRPWQLSLNCCKVVYHDRNVVHFALVNEFTKVNQCLMLVIGPYEDRHTDSSHIQANNSLL